MVSHLFPRRVTIACSFGRTFGGVGEARVRHHRRARRRPSSTGIKRMIWEICEIEKKKKKKKKEVVSAQKRNKF